MSRRIMDKLLHPIFKAIRETATDFDAKKSAEEYKEKLAQRGGPVADHVDINS